MTDLQLLAVSFCAALIVCTVLIVMVCCVRSSQISEWRKTTVVTAEALIVLVIGLACLLATAPRIYRR